MRIDPRMRNKPPQFGLRKRRVNADRAVVQRNRIPPEQPSRRGQELTRQHVPLQVDGDDGHPRRAREIGERLDDLLIFEMVQEQSADDDVDAA